MANQLLIASQLSVGRNSFPSVQGASAKGTRNRASCIQSKQLEYYWLLLSVPRSERPQVERVAKLMYGP